MKAGMQAVENMLNQNMSKPPELENGRKAEQWPRDLVMVLAYMIVAAFQMAWHWLAIHPSAKPLLNFYFYRDPVSLKGNPGYFDIVLPSFLLGLAIGALGWNSSRAKLSVYVIIAGIMIAILEPSYSLVLGRSMMWWLPNSGTALVGQTMIQAFKATVHTGVFVYAVCLYCKYKNTHRILNGGEVKGK